MPLHPRTCSLLYSISCLLDALDGLAARHFEQSTRFGAVLDMVTDRCTTACLLVFLSSAWPRWSLLFQGLISLDLASHYMHMYATLTMAGSGQSHKKIDQSRSRILYLYYNNKVCVPLHSYPLKLTNLVIERSLRILRAQRGLFHCPLSTLVLISHLVTFASSTPSKLNRIVSAAGQSLTSHPIDALRKPIQCRGSGARPREQDGQLLALGDSWNVFPGHGGQAVHQCGTAGQGKPMVGRR